jgi:transposase-like protein
LKGALRQWFETLKYSEEGTDWLRDLIGWLFQEILDLEYKEHLGAISYERNEEKKGYINGYSQ